MTINEEPHSLSLWKNARFSRFFASMSMSNLGDWLDIFALQIIFVHAFHASPMTMGLLAVCCCENKLDSRSVLSSKIAQKSFADFLWS